VKTESVPNEARTSKLKDASEVLAQNELETGLIVLVCLGLPLEIALEAIFALVPLDLLLHDTLISGRAGLHAVAKPDVVVDGASKKLDTRTLKGGVKVVESLLEEDRKQEEGRALIEAEAIFGIDQAATPAGEVVLFQDRHLDSGLGETSCSSDTAGSSTWRR
jgi:hypothetical protein